MDRARLVLAAALVCACVLRAVPMAQTTSPPDGWVVLPVDEYRALRDRANPPPTPIAPPPVDSTLTRVDYDLRVEAESVVGRALLTVDVLREGWTRLQIPAGLMVREATLDGQPVALVDGPPPHVLLSHAGRSIVTLDVVVPLTTSGGGESMTLPASSSPISRVRFALPRSGVDLSLVGGFLADRAGTGNESRWTAFGLPNQALTMRWKRKVDDRRAEQPLRVRARVTQVVALGEDSSQVAAAIRVEVLQGLAREVTLSIPAGLVVNQVNGSTVADWDTSGGLLRVKLLEPTVTEVSLVVTGDARTARDGSIDVPIVRMPSAERETGGVAVDVAGAGEIRARQARGFEPADPSELGDLVAGRESPSMIAFRHRPLAGSDARALAVTVVRYTPQAVFIANIEEARYRALASEDGRLLVEARYAVRNNQRSFLKATLPQGSSIWSAQVGGRPIRPGVAEANAVLLPLQKGRAGEEAPAFVVELLYLQQTEGWVDKGSAHIELPAIDLPVSRTRMELHHSPRFRVEPQPGSFRVESDPGPLIPALPPPPPVAAPSSRLSESGAAGGLQALVDRFKNEPGGRIVVGSLPVRASFPSFGPSVFLASELTAEASTPSVDLIVRRVK